MTLKYNVPLKRLAPGLYTAVIAGLEYDITYIEVGSRWIWRRATNPDVCSDFFPTLREARLSLDVYAASIGCATSHIAMTREHWDTLKDWLVLELTTEQYNRLQALGIEIQPCSQ